MVIVVVVVVVEVVVVVLVVVVVVVVVVVLVVVVVVVAVVVGVVVVVVAVVQCWRNAFGPRLRFCFPLGFPIGVGRHEKEGREGDASEEALGHPDHLP
jgi:hypothetical protein